MARKSRKRRSSAARASTKRSSEPARQPEPDQPSGGARADDAAGEPSEPDAPVFRPWVLALVLAALGLAIARPFLVGEPPREASAFSEDDFQPVFLPYPEARRIGVDDAMDELDAGTSLFLDVRPLDEFLVERVPGAISMPVDDIPERHEELDPSQRYLLYCT